MAVLKPPKNPYTKNMANIMLPNAPSIEPAIALPRGALKSPMMLNRKPIGLNIPHVRTPMIDVVSPAMPIALAPPGCFG